MPSKDEIYRISVEMISQVHRNYNLRNRIVNNDTGKSSSIFIKDITHKMKDDSKETRVEKTKPKDSKTKKWEPKKKVQFQISDVPKTMVQEKNVGSYLAK